jgi:hypothetical protein
MAILVNDCPRCRAKNMTFDVRADTQVDTHHGWQRWFEAFCVCRHCHNSIIFVLAQKPTGEPDFWAKNSPSNFNASLNSAFTIEGYICLKDVGAVSTPEHVPGPVATVFHEGAVSVAVGNWNAAGAMFRAAIDLATRPMLPKEPTPPEKDVEGLNKRVRRDLGIRLPWLFDNGHLPSDLRELSRCVHQDGNDGAHAGTLSGHDAHDLLDFATALLERIFTEPERLRLAQERRDRRRQSAPTAASRPGDGAEAP